VRRPKHNESDTGPRHHWQGLSARSTSPPSPLERGVVNTGFRGCRTKAGSHTIKLGCSLQRLFSTFPDGWPGRGLLLLRLGAGILLTYSAITGLSEPAGGPVTVASNLVTVAGGALLLVGLWTPVVGGIIAIDQLWIASLQHFSPPCDLLIHVLLAVMSAGIAMLGPGAWSIDAHLFGRRRFEIGKRTPGR
jgi:putative oxidoreductase